MNGGAFSQLPQIQHVTLQEERQRLAAGMAAAVAHTSSAPQASSMLEQPPTRGQQGIDGAGGDGGGQEDSLLADADFSRYILGEDPISGGGELDGGYANDDYDPEHPF